MEKLWLKSVKGDFPILKKDEIMPLYLLEDGDEEYKKLVYIKWDAYDLKVHVVDCPKEMNEVDDEEE